MLWIKSVSFPLHSYIDLISDVYYLFFDSHNWIVIIATQTEVIPSIFLVLYLVLHGHIHLLSEDWLACHLVYLIDNILERLVIRLVKETES